MEDRRSFLKWATHALGGLFAMVLGVPAVGYLTDPRNRSAAAGEFKRVAKLSELVENVPRAVVIRDIRRDAWTLHPNDVLGRAWLIRRSDGQVEAYTATCPHLGGPINFDGNQFVCPFHGATFNMQCQRVLEKDDPNWVNPAPRDMDNLELKLVPDPNNENDFFVEVKYENFIQGREEKVKKA